MQRKKIKLKKKDLFYRAAYRQDYRKFLYLSTGVKLTYLIEDLVRKYFTLRVKIKICWPLSQFKNLKFYRLVYPQYKQRRQNKKTLSLKIKKNNYLARKKYYYLGQNTQHLKYNSQNVSFTANIKKSQLLKKTLLNFWQQEKKKKTNIWCQKKKLLLPKAKSDYLGLQKHFLLPDLSPR